MTGPGLGPGRAGFDSPVPDDGLVAQPVARRLGRAEVPGSTPGWSTHAPRAQQVAARGAPWRVRLSDRPPGSQPGKTGSTPVLAAMPAFQAGVAGSTPVHGSIEGSANGRPPGFGPGNGGSSPPPSALAGTLPERVVSEARRPDAAKQRPGDWPYACRGGPTVEAPSSNLGRCGFDSRPRYPLPSKLTRWSARPVRGRLSVRIRPEARCGCSTTEVRRLAMPDIGVRFPAAAPTPPRQGR